MDERWIVVVYSYNGTSRVFAGQFFNTDIQAKNYLRTLLSDPSTEWSFGEIKKVFVPK